MSIPSASTSEPSTTSSTSSTSSSSSDFWHPPQYLLFESFRSRPGYDLIRRVSETLDTFQLDPTDHIKRIVDLGCGTGKLTLELARHFPSAESVQGCDSSNNMLEKARSEIHKLEDENLKQKISWKLEGFRQLKDCGGIDLIFSNAALHWDNDHSSLFPHLLTQLRSPGGILAVQIPNNFNEPSHILMRTAMEEGKFLPKDEIERVFSNQPSLPEGGAAYYYHLLRPHSRHVDVWQTEYFQPISSSTSNHPVLEWTKSTGCAPVLASLKSDEDRKKYEEIYSRLLESAYPSYDANVNGATVRQVLFPFKRIFMIAIK